MPPHLSTDVAPAAESATRIKPFAAPSKQGLLICAASLMPAYLFGLLGLAGVFGLVTMMQNSPADDPRGAAAGWIHLGHQVLTTAFNILLCWLFLVRRPSAGARGVGGRWSDAIAIGGTAIVLALSMMPKTVDDLLAIAAAEVLMTLGLIVMVVGLASLGRSFGIMPRARGLVTSGLYQWVRHPIYLGEFLVFAGIAMLAISPLTVAIYVAFVVLQTYRLVVEEKTLESAYPEYASYKAGTARLLPGVY